MKGNIIFLGLFVVLSSCNPQNDKERIQNFIFAGYPGFYLADTAKWQYDSTRFDIREYLEYTIDSSVKISSRGYNTDTKFYKINKSDSIHLVSIFNKLLSIELKDSDYYVQYGLELYDGLHYTLNFETTGNRRVNINYVPHHLPGELKGIHDSIEKIVWLAKNAAAGSFSFNALLKQNAIELYRILPPPPAPETSYPRVKFTKPVIIKDSKN